MIELKRLKLINWHNFENTTFDCARLTYMIGVNAVGKTTILDAIRYCLTTNRNFNALGNKKSGRTLQGSVHAKQRGENAYRRPGHTVAYIGAEFWDSVKHTSFVIAVRVESEGPMQELHPGDQTWYISEDGITLEQLPFIDPRTGAPSAKEDFKPAEGRLSYTRSPSEARDRICRALGIGRAASPLGKKFNEVFQMGTSMDEIPNFREFLYQYILPQPELDLEALQGDRLELENLHAVLAEAQTRADALDEIVRFGREATEKQTEALVNRGAALLARAAADAGEKAVWQERVDAGRRQQETLRTRYAEAKTAEAEARRAYLTAHSAAGASGEGRALDALSEELAHRQTALDAAARRADTAEKAAEKTGNLLAVLRRSGFAAGQKLADLTPDTLPALTDWLTAQEKPLEEAYFAARQHTAALQRQQTEKRAELDAVSGGKWVYPHGDAATRVRDAVNAELKSRGMEPDARIFCELLNVEDESWQDCVEACLGDRRFDILVPPAHYAAAKERLCGAEGESGSHQPAGHPGSAQGQPPRRYRPRRQSGGTGHQRKPACRAVRRHHPAPHRLLRHPRHAGKLPRQRHPGPSASPSLPVGASAHPAALYRLGSPPRPRRGTGRGDERPCRGGARRRTGRAEPESRIQPVPDPFARHNAGRACRFVGRPRRPDRRPRGGGRAGRKAG